MGNLHKAVAWYLLLPEALCFIRLLLYRVLKQKLLFLEEIDNTTYNCYDSIGWFMNQLRKIFEIIYFLQPSQAIVTTPVGADGKSRDLAILLANRFPIFPIRLANRFPILLFQICFSNIWYQELAIILELHLWTAFQLFAQFIFRCFFSTALNLIIITNLSSGLQCCSV